MKLTRRKFLQLTSAVAAGVAGTTLTQNVAHADASTDLRIRYVKATPTICPYCSVGCGILVHSTGGKIINAEGDPDNPVNQGSLCSKGSSVIKYHDNPRRLTKPLYRAPGSTEWEEKDWDWMLEKIVFNIKKTRDATFVHEENGMTVNRTEGIAAIGSSILTNEECYIYQKLSRGLGLVYVEHEARL
jgi:formate dehydrogenase major subunit